MGRLTWNTAPAHLGAQPGDQIADWIYRDTRHWTLWYLVEGRRLTLHNFLPNAPQPARTVLWRFGDVLNNATLSQARDLAMRQLYFRARRPFRENMCRECIVVGAGLGPVSARGPIAWTKTAPARWW